MAKQIKKSFATPSAKPADVQYRVRRALETADELVMFLGAVDPTGMPNYDVNSLFEQAVALLKCLEEANEAVPLTRAQLKARAAIDAAISKTEPKFTVKVTDDGQVTTAAAE